MKTKNLAFALYSCRRECDSEDVVTADRSPATLERQRGGDKGVGRPGGCPALHDTGTQLGPPVPAVHEPRLPSLPSVMPQPLQDPTEQKPNLPGVELGCLPPPPPALLGLVGLTTVVQVANDGFGFYRDAHKNLVGKKAPRACPAASHRALGCRASGARAALSHGATRLAGGRASPGVTELTRHCQGPGLAPWRGWHLPSMGRALGQASLGWGSGCDQNGAELCNPALTEHTCTPQALWRGAEQLTLWPAVPGLLGAGTGRAWKLPCCPGAAVKIAQVHSRS